MNVNAINKKDLQSIRFENSPFNLQDEIQACERYMERKTMGCEKGDEQKTRLEDAAIFLFEYTREAFLVLSKTPSVKAEDQDSARLRFRLSAPYSIIVNSWPKIKGANFPSIPWTSLSTGKQGKIIRSLSADSRYDKNKPKLERFNLIQHHGRGTLEKFIKATDKVGKIYEKGDGGEDFKQMIAPMVPTEEGQGNEFHVIFTIDLRESNERLNAAFTSWLDQKRHEYNIGSKKLHGKIFQERLNDLAFFRFWREKGGDKGIDNFNSSRIKKLPFPKDPSSRSDARRRVVETVTKLLNFNFSDVRDLELNLAPHLPAAQKKID